MIALTGVVGALLLGHYGAYTYITRLVDGPAAALPGGTSTVLLLFGLASAAGVAVAGRVGARTGRALVVSAGLTAVALLLMPAAATGAAVGTGVVLLWAVASGALPPLAQTAILRLGGPEHRTTASALIPVVFNGGIAVGAAAAAAVVAGHGAGAVTLPAAAVVVVAAVAAGVVMRGRDAVHADPAEPADGVLSSEARPASRSR